MLVAGRRIFGDVGLVLEVKLRGQRHMQRFSNSEMDMSRSREPGVLLQSRKIGRDGISSRHDGLGQSGNPPVRRVRLAQPAWFAADVLRIARAAGVIVTLDGGGLLLEAGSEPPQEVLDTFALHKATIRDLLTPFEQPCLTRRGRIEERPDGVFLHFCVECGRWGAFGYGASVREGRLGRWYCAEHRPASSDARASSKCPG